MQRYLVRLMLKVGIGLLRVEVFEFKRRQTVTDTGYTKIFYVIVNRVADNVILVRFKKVSYLVVYLVEGRGFEKFLLGICEDDVGATRPARKTKLAFGIYVYVSVLKNIKIEVCYNVTEGAYRCLASVGALYIENQIFH